MTEFYGALVIILLTLFATVAMLEPDEISDPPCSEINCGDVLAAIRGHNFPCDYIDRVSVNRNIFDADCRNYSYLITLVNGIYRVSERR